MTTVLDRTMMTVLNMTTDTAFLTTDDTRNTSDRLMTDTVTSNTNTVFNTTDATMITLQQLNDEEFYRRLAPVIYLSVLMALGVPGNLLVLIVYYRNFKVSTHRTFILMLAAVDFGVCAISLPFEIIEMRYQYTFYVVSACKFFRANNNFLSLGSIFTIFCMSMDRYRRMCHPLKKQMTPRMCKFFCGGSMVAAFLFAWPNFVISGIRHVSLKNNVTGSDCSLSDKYAKTIFPLAYGGTLFLIFVIVIITLIVVYSLIARKIYKHSKFRGRFTSSSSISTNTQTSSISLQSIQKKTEKEANAHPTEPEQKDVMAVSGKRNEKKYKKQPIVTKEGSQQRFKGNSKKYMGKDTQRSIKDSNKDQRRTAKITRITFMISLVFILSYLPHLTLSLMTAVKGGFIAKPGPVVSALLPIVTRSFVINNVANPIIYGFFDPKFRNICKNGLKIMFRKR